MCARYALVDGRVIVAVADGVDVWLGIGDEDSIGDALAPGGIGADVDGPMGEGADGGACCGPVT